MSCHGIALWPQWPSAGLALSLLEDRVRTGLGHAYHSQHGPLLLVTTNATAPQVQDRRERWSYGLSQPQSPDWRQRDSRQTESGHLFPGVEEGQQAFFFSSCFQTNFKMVMIKQTLCTVTASHLIHSFDPNHSLK